MAACSSGPGVSSCTASLSVISPSPCSISMSAGSPPSLGAQVHGLVDHLLIVAALRLRVAQIPQEQVVVAVHGLDQIGLEVELHAHLSEIVAEQIPDFPADGGVGQPVARLREHAPALGYERIVVLVGLRPSARAPGAPSKRRRSWRSWEAPHETAATSLRRPGISCMAKTLDACILDQRDERHLDGTQGATGKRSVE